jgi:hypothetical protein
MTAQQHLPEPTQAAGYHLPTSRRPNPALCATPHRHMTTQPQRPASTRAVRYRLLATRRPDPARFALPAQPSTVQPRLPASTRAVRYRLLAAHHSGRVFLASHHGHSTAEPRLSPPDPNCPLSPTCRPPVRSGSFTSLDLRVTAKLQLPAPNRVASYRLLVARRFDRPLSASPDPRSTTQPQLPAPTRSIRYRPLAAHRPDPLSSPHPNGIRRPAPDAPFQPEPPTTALFRAPAHSLPQRLTSLIHKGRSPGGRPTSAPCGPPASTQAQVPRSVPLINLVSCIPSTQHARSRPSVPGGTVVGSQTMTIRLDVDERTQRRSFDRPNASGIRWPFFPPLIRARAHRHPLPPDVGQGILRQIPTAGAAAAWRMPVDRRIPSATTAHRPPTTAPAPLNSERTHR